MTGNPTFDRLSAAPTENDATSVTLTIFQDSPDDQLIAAWESTSGATGDSIAHLGAELQRREVEF